MDPAYINTLLPSGYVAKFIPAEDESVDDEFVILDATGGETGVSVQLCPASLVVSLWNEANSTIRYWPSRYFGEETALRDDLANALETRTAP